MSYLLDKKIKRKKFITIAVCVVVFFILVYFRSSIFYGFSFASHTFFRPVLTLGNSFGGKLGSIGSFFISKSSLYSENENLRLELSQARATALNYNAILAENISLKETLGRKDERTNLVLASILEKPNQSPYDTLVIDMGANKGLKIGNIVFGLGDIPLGRVAEVYPNSSKVILFSNSGEKSQVVMSHDYTESGVVGGEVFLEIVGRGGGNFEMLLQRDFKILKGDQLVLPGIFPYVLGIVEKIISDPRDSFTKVLLVSPLNIQELKFVEVEI